MAGTFFTAPSCAKTVSEKNSPISNSPSTRTAAGILIFFRPVKIEHPVDLKLIHQHAKLCAPEGILQWHGYFTTFGQGRKYTVNILFMLEIKRQLRVGAMGNLISRPHHIAGHKSKAP